MTSRRSSTCPLPALLTGRKQEQPMIATRSHQGLPGNRLPVAAATAAAARRLCRPAARPGCLLRAGVRNCGARSSVPCKGRRGAAGAQRERHSKLKAARPNVPSLGRQRAQSGLGECSLENTTTALPRHHDMPLPPAACRLGAPTATAAPPLAAAAVREELHPAQQAGHGHAHQHSCCWR